MMNKKEGRLTKSKDRRREEILELCYKRLEEMIPMCESEVTLIKCIEILNKQGGDPRQSEEDVQALQVITDTLDRLAKIK